MLAIALAVSLKFPRLHELVRSIPSAFKYFYDSCLDTEWDLAARGDAGQAAVEYHPHWEHVPTRVFFRELASALRENNPMEAPASSAIPNFVASAFRLTALSG